MTIAPTTPAPTGPLREASWRTRRFTAGDLHQRLADLPDDTPVLIDDEVLTTATYDDGIVRLHTVLTAPMIPPIGVPVAPASVWRSARTALLRVGELCDHLAGVPDFAPVYVDGGVLEGADYDGGLWLYTPDSGIPDEDDVED